MFSLCLKRSLKMHFTTYKKALVTHIRYEDHRHLLSRFYDEVLWNKGLFNFPKSTAVQVWYIDFYSALLHFSASLCKHRGLSPFYSFSEPIFLPDGGWNRQPKHVVELNENRYTRSILLCSSESKLNNCLIKHKRRLPSKIFRNFAYDSRL